MAFKISGKLEGLEQTLRALKGLDAKVAKKAVRKGINDASRILMKAVKAKAPRDTGQLRKSIGRKIKTYRNSGNIVAIVGPRTGFKDPETGRNPTQYAHLIELGTSRLAARPFMRPALESSKLAMVEAIKSAVGEAAKGASAA